MNTILDFLALLKSDGTVWLKMTFLLAVGATTLTGSDIS
jgi:hypothetical protein